MDKDTGIILKIHIKNKKDNQEEEFIKEIEVNLNTVIEEDVKRSNLTGYEIEYE